MVEIPAQKASLQTLHNQQLIDCSISNAIKSCTKYIGIRLLSTRFRSISTSYFDYIHYILKVLIAQPYKPTSDGFRTSDEPIMCKGSKVFLRQPSIAQLLASSFLAHEPTQLAVPNKRRSKRRNKSIQTLLNPAPPHQGEALQRGTEEVKYPPTRPHRPQP